jgi:hypothetical protein
MRAVLLAAALAALPSLTQAGIIERACLSSERSGGDRALCGCIQQAANRTLTASDQRLAARFFADPDRAQEIRQSDRRSHAVFWERYRSFGEFAEAVCAR